MKIIKAYIIWLWKVRPRIVFSRRRLSRKILLKIMLKKYANQSPSIEPWPYKNYKPKG